MSDQPSDQPKPVLVLIGVVSLLALAASLYVGITTQMSVGQPAAHAAPAQPG